MFALTYRNFSSSFKKTKKKTLPHDALTPSETAICDFFALRFVHKQDANGNKIAISKLSEAQVRMYF